VTERLIAFWRAIPWRGLRTRFILMLWAVGFLALVPTSTPQGDRLEEKVLGKARDVLYNYAAWEVEAVFAKIRQAHGSPVPFMDESTRVALVLDYAQAIAKVGELNRQIDASLSDPTLPNAAPLIAQRNAQQTIIARLEPLAEAIIEGQIAAVLHDEGFTLLGGVFPPVSAKITTLPMLLVISPREVIRRDLAINTVNLAPDAILDLETQIDHDLGVSSIIVPLGGLALYPSMILQTGHLPTLYEIVAHEWAHHYLYFFPLGLEYLNSGGETWIINETTASLFGVEIGRKTIERFYADYPEVLRLLPPPDSARLPRTPAPATPTPMFDAAAVMNETRVEVDRLLAAGNIDAAEAYMEAQRQRFVANGYRYRKINQAFFAFYGGYQSPSGGGTAGEDPIGPAVAALRRALPSLRAWMEVMRGITSRGGLLRAQDQAHPTGQP